MLHLLESIKSLVDYVNIVHNGCIQDNLFGLAVSQLAYYCPIVSKLRGTPLW